MTIFTYHWLQGCPNLEEFELYENDEVTDTQIRKLANLKEVRRLDVSMMSRVSMMAIAETILQLPKLVDLEMVGTDEGDSVELTSPSELPISYEDSHAMAKLLQCTSLTSLNVSENYKFGRGCFLPFNTNKFPYLRMLYASGCSFGGEDLEAIVNGCPNLEKLDLFANRKIRNAGIIKLGHSESKLIFLNLLMVQKLADSGLMALAECPSLRKFFMGKSKITERGLSAFAQGCCSSSLRGLVSSPFPPPPPYAVPIG